MKKVFNLILLMGTLVSPAGASEMACLPSGLSCSAYLCEEARRGCGVDGYLLSYGYRYCRRYLIEEKSNLTLQGQRWMERTSACLQERILAEGLERSCEELREVAMKQHHPDCYVESGWCSLPPSDQIKVQLVSLQDPSNWLSYLKYFLGDDPCD